MMTRYRIWLRARTLRARATSSKEIYPQTSTAIERCESELGRDLSPFDGCRPRRTDLALAYHGQGKRRTQQCQIILPAVHS